MDNEQQNIEAGDEVDEVDEFDEGHEYAQNEATPLQSSPLSSTMSPMISTVSTSAISEDPSIIAAIPIVPQLPAMSLSGNNAQRTLWIGDVPGSWTEETLGKVFSLKGYCFVEFVSFEQARQALFDLNGTRVQSQRDVRFNLCFANDSYNPNAEFNLHVASVPIDMSDAELYRIFDKYHSCRGAKMFRFLDGSSKGTGFVRFGNQTDQQMALVEMHRTRVGGSRILLRLAGPKGEKLDRGDGAINPFNQPPPKRERFRREDKKASQFRNGTAVPQQAQMIDPFGNPIVVPVDKNIYGTDNPWGVFPDDGDIDQVIGLDLLTTKYCPQISNKRLMIEGDQFMLDLDSSRWSPIVFKTNIRREDLEKRLIDNPWTPIP
uniref:RRM domain-containing protein n=1 Tax=Caenorhabditis japonica TaxID=281687 RepID=A0A8R1HQH7_CAEJA